MTYRILVTGSRSWDDRAAVCDALFLAALNRGFEGLVVVSGHCPVGADAIADQWVKRNHHRGVRVEHHPADWNSGRLAGPLRNRRMVQAGADECIAFIGPCTSPRCREPRPHGSHGATGCADLAEAAGIPTKRWTS